MSVSYDVVVIGGGIVGASLAYHCVRKGARTLLVDRGEPGQASQAGAGIVSPEANVRDPEPWFAFAAAAAADYPSLIAALEPYGETGFDRCGMLVVALGEPEARGLDAYRKRLRALGRGAEELRPIGAAAARERFPLLAPLVGALEDPGAARVDGRRLNTTLIAAAEAHGLERFTANARELRLRGSRVEAVVIGGTAVSCGAVGLAAGAWSAELGRSLGVAIAVEPQRGQILHFGHTGVDTRDWPIIGALGDYYLVAWPGGRVVCGATRETGAGFEARTTAAGVRAVIEQALTLAPGLADWTLLEIRVGLRPLTRDGLPIIGLVPGVENAYLATGHGPTGLTLGPYTGKRVAELMLGDTSAADLEAFRLDRSGLTARES